MFEYAHMCQDGHQQIGHNDSSNEICPLCRMTQSRNAFRDMYNSLVAYHKKQHDAKDVKIAATPMSIIQEMQDEEEPRHVR